MDKYNVYERLLKAKDEKIKHLLERKKKLLEEANELRAWHNRQKMKVD
jgi:predicted CopG family antitoxin